MNFKHFDKKNAELKFKGIVANVYHKKFPKGEYEYVVLPDTVRVIPVTKDKEIIVIKEKVFSMNKYFYSFPGGGVEDNESLLKACKRELEEETGYSSKKFKEWLSFNNSQTVINNRNFVIAYDCEFKNNKHLEETENIEVLKVSLDKFIKICLDDNFKFTEIQNMFFKWDKAGKIKKNLSELLGLSMPTKNKSKRSNINERLAYA